MILSDERKRQGQLFLLPILEHVTLKPPFSILVVVKFWFVIIMTFLFFPNRMA